MAIEKFTTPESLDVYVENIPTMRNKNVRLVVKAGSVDEPDELAGVSHALEHCVFLKTPQFANEQASNDYADENGFYHNANTYYTRTSFYANGITLDPMINFVGQMVLEPLFGEEEVDREMNAVRREAKTGLEEIDGLAVAFEDFVLHGKPYGRDVIGYSDKLNFSEQQLVDYYTKMYKVGNMALVVVGNTNPDEVAKLIEDNFNMSQRLGAAIRSPLPVSSSPIPDESAFGYVRSDTESARVSLAVKHPIAMSERIEQSRWGYAAAATLLSNKVFNTLRTDLGLSYDGSFAASSYNHESARKMTADVTVDVSNTQRAIDELRKITSKPATSYSDSDLKRVLTMMQVHAANNVDNIAGRANAHVARLAHNKEPVSADDSFKEMESTTIGDVRIALDDILQTWQQSKEFEFVTGPAEAVGDRYVVDQSNFA